MKQIIHTNVDSLITNIGTNYTAHFVPGTIYLFFSIRRQDVGCTFFPVVVAMMNNEFHSA